MATTVVDADLICMSCGRGRTLRVTTLAELPPRESCSVCGGSIVVTGWQQRTVRIEAPFDWDADRPKVGRPRARRKGGKAA